MKKENFTSDGLKIIDRLFFEGQPERMAELEEARANDAIGRKIYEIRKAARISQRELGKLVGTTASVIRCLEDADYEGNSLAMLNRIAAALNRRVEINFVPLGPRARRSVGGVRSAKART